MKHAPKNAIRSRGAPTAERLTPVYAALMLSLFILFPGLDGYRAVTEWKWRLLCLLSGGYIALVLLLKAELYLIGDQRPAAPRKKLREWLTPAELLLLGYWLASGISTLLAVDRRVAFWGGARREGFVTITLCCWSCLLVSRRLTPRRWMLWLFGAAMCLCCALGFVQLAGFNPLSLYPEGMTYYDANRLYAGEFLGTVGNVDILSAVLCLAVPAFAAAALKLRHTPRWPALCFAAVCLVMLGLARVAGGAVGVLGCAVISAPVLLRGKARRRAVIAVAALCAFALALAFFLGDRLGGTVGELSALLHGRLDDSFGSGRIYIWRSVLPLVPERLLFGGGPDTLSLRLDAVFERWDETLGILIRSDIDTAHNEYLGILVDQGLIALLCYLGLLGVLARKWFRCASTDGVCAVAGCAALGYSIQAFFGIRSPISTPLFYLALALLLRPGTEAAPEDIPCTQKKEETGSWKRKRPG